MKLVLASNNPGKLREIEALLAPPVELVAQSELGIAEAEEPHASFVENALAKAQHASRAARLPALADDSGLCVDALGGEPGVHSAYYAGREGSREERDARNNAKLLSQLGAERSAADAHAAASAPRAGRATGAGDPPRASIDPGIGPAAAEDGHPPRPHVHAAHADRG